MLTFPSKSPSALSRSTSSNLLSYAELNKSKIDKSAI
jgi:hypothetical protein